MPSAPADPKAAPPPPGQLLWGVREEGNKVFIELECHDAYEAIELAEVCAAGLAEGKLTIEVSDT